jgi:hypothetical protein
MRTGGALPSRPTDHGAQRRRQAARSSPLCSPSASVHYPTNGRYERATPAAWSFRNSVVQTRLPTDRLLSVRRLKQGNRSATFLSGERHLFACRAEVLPPYSHIAERHSVSLRTNFRPTLCSQCCVATTLRGNRNRNEHGDGGASRSKNQRLFHKSPPSGTRAADPGRPGEGQPGSRSPTVHFGGLGGKGAAGPVKALDVLRTQYHPELPEN